MKKFNLQDVFLLSKIIDKLELKFEVDKLAKTIRAEKLESQEDVMKIGKDVLLTIGLDIATKFLANLHRADKEVVQLISNITEKKTEAVEEMGLKEIKDFFTELLQAEGVKDFFSQAETSDQ